MAARVKLNSAGIQALLESGEVRADLTDRAARVLSAAQSSAPYDPTRTSGEHYRDSLHIVQDTTDRAVVRVVAGAAHGYVVEANTGTLARALDAGR